MDETGNGDVNVLCLSRKKNETVLLGDNIEVVIVEIRGDKVRLGIRAPENVPLFRGEIYAAKKRSGDFIPDLVPAQPAQNTLVGA